MEKFIILAREARELGNNEDALKYYDKVRLEDPFNAEAKFFYQYYSTITCKNGEIPTKLQQLYKCVEPTFELIKKSQMSEEEKVSLVTEICQLVYNDSEEIYWHMRGLSCFEASEIAVVGKEQLYQSCYLDKLVVKVFGEQEQFASILVYLWKKQIEKASFGERKTFYNQQTKLVYAEMGIKEDWRAYLNEKIKKYEPSYQIPEEPVQKSLGNIISNFIKKITKKSKK